MAGAQGVKLVYIGLPLSLLRCISALVTALRAKDLALLLLDAARALIMLGNRKNNIREIIATTDSNSIKVKP
ncbi:hypothetical protein DAERI_050187 [Deinococcus aerius]|uniref:Uncharacterized protein n=1 Tax=Deinococcus aerius TaxID=200253 RepID=A0A2I9DHJ1_9DEIO|nr:hypothetical protein DAERI_050187 [Deinococcus aerius]